MVARNRSAHIGRSGSDLAARPQRRRVSKALAWLFAGIALFGLLVCWCTPPQLERVFPVPQLAAAGPWYALPAAAACALGVWSRRKFVFTVALVCLIVQVAIVVPWWLPTIETPSGLSALRVMTLNAYHGRADARSIVDVVVEQGVDVLLLQETTAELVSALEQEGLTELLPNRVGAIVGSQIWSSLPLTDAVDDAVGYEGSSMPAATVELPVDGKRMRVVSVHTCSPTPGYEGLWARSLGLLASIPENDPGTYDDGTPYLLVGDFNSSVYHASFRTVLNAGFTDGACASGEGLAFTWPVDDGRFPLVTLDHVLLGPGLAAGSFAYIDVPGTDHLAVIATVGAA